MVVSTSALATPVGPFPEGAFGFLDFFPMITVDVASYHRVDLYVDRSMLPGSETPHKVYATPTHSSVGTLQNLIGALLFMTTPKKQRYDSHVTCFSAIYLRDRKILLALIFMRLLVASAVGRLRERS